MQISVLIVNWNSKDYLHSCLKSIYATANDLVTQIVVVDGASYDGCNEMLAKEFPYVEFHQNKENIGFGGSNNFGFSHIRNDILLLLNPDTQLLPNSLQNMLKTLLSNSKIGIVGAKLLNTDLTYQNTSIRSAPTPFNCFLSSDYLKTRFPRWKIWSYGLTKTTLNQDAIVEAVSGAAMLMKRDTFSSVGGFTPYFFMYGEDMDLCMKVRRKKLLVAHSRKAEIIHHGGGSTKTETSYFNTIMLRNSGFIYMRLNHGTAAANTYKLLQGLSAVIRILISIARLPSTKETNSKPRQTIRKWWHILRWSLGYSDINHPIAHSNYLKKELNYRNQHSTNRFIKNLI